MDFTTWESELYHHGIKGMKWGVRRYQNADGSLTAAGQKRYGDSPTKNTSARKMQRDFNNLAKGYANAEARRHRADYLGMKYAKKEKQLLHEKKEWPKRLIEKRDKAARQFIKADDDRWAIESLQRRILSQAVKKGYTISSKEVTRYGTTGGAYAAQILSGVIGQIAYQVATKGSGQVAVRGAKVKIRAGQKGG